MKNKNLMNRIIMLFAFLLATSNSFAQITTEEDMAKAIFKTIKNSDIETFKSYGASDSKMTNTVAGMGGSTPKEKSIKQELRGEKAENFTKECINKFNLLQSELTNNNIKIKEGVFVKIKTNKVRCEVEGLKASKIKFIVAFDKKEYEIRIDIFKTKNDMFIYDFSFTKPEIKK